MGGAGWNGEGPAGGFGRTVLVVSQDSELAVALRDRLDRAYVTVCAVWPEEAETAVRGCRPWPWLVVGDAGDVPAAAVRLLLGRPTLVVWRGSRPPGLGRDTYVVERFSELAATVEAAVGAEAGGMRLAPGGGLTMPDGGHVTSPALEALVAVHPGGLFAAARHFGGVAAALEAHGVPLRLAQRGRGGLRILEENI